MSENMDRLNDVSPTIRGDMGFGKKPNRGFLNRMASERPIDIHHYDEVTGMTTIETIFNAQAIIDANKAFKLSGKDGYSPSKDMKWVARIPTPVVEQFYRDGLDIFNKDDWEIIKALLDTNDYSDFRTSEGTISKRPRRQYITPAGRR